METPFPILGEGSIYLFRLCPGVGRGVCHGRCPGRFFSGNFFREKARQRREKKKKKNAQKIRSSPGISELTCHFLSRDGKVLVTLPWADRGVVPAFVPCYWGEQ